MLRNTQAAIVRLRDAEKRRFLPICGERKSPRSASLPSLSFLLCPFAKDAERHAHTHERPGDVCAPRLTPSITQMLSET